MPTSERRRSRYTFYKMQKKSGHYYGVLNDREGEKSPAKKWFRLGTTKKPEAYAEYERLKHLFWVGEWSPWQSTDDKTQYTVAEAVGEYMGQYEDQVREKSAKNMRGVLRLFKNHVGEKTAIRSVTADHIRSWLDTPTSGPGGAPSPSTIQTYHSRLSQAMRWMVAEGILQENPCDNVDTPDEAGKTFTVLDPSELDELIRQVIKSAERHAQPVQTWLLHVLNFNPCAGLRLGELCALRWADVERLSAESDMCTVRIRPYSSSEVEGDVDGFSPKTRGSVRQVHIWPRGTYVLRRLWTEAGGPDDPPSDERLVFRGGTGGPLSYQWTIMKFREHCEDCGLIRRDEDGQFLKRVRPHDVRHSYISWMVNEFEHRLGIRTVAQMAGHEDIEMTEGYWRPNQQSARDAMLRAGEKKPEGGRRPSYEVVRDWLHAEPVYALEDLEPARQ